MGNQAATVEAAPAATSFDGADYSTEADKIAHGERLAEVLGCNSCHREDYSGFNFGEFVPIVEGLWATNISLTMPEMSDGELERLLGDGVDRDGVAIESNWGQDHTPAELTDGEIAEAISYTRALAKQRME